TAVLDGDGDPALAACLDRRGAWPRAVGDAWRAVHRDEIPGLPAAIDIYGTRYNAVWFDEEADPAPLAAVLDELVARLGLVGGVVRVHRRNPHQRGLKEEVAVRGDVPETFAVTEHGLTYAINLRSTQHTGLFPDQRDTRRRVARIAAGRRVGNLFAFTCSFSVAAVAAGAEVAFSVDTARSCLETGKANFAGNGLADAGRGKFIQEDARRWLARQQRRREEDPDAWQPLDLLVCDPPVFASGKEGRFAVEKEWAGLARAGAELLGPDGVAVFANNHRTGDHARYRRQLQAVFGRVTDLRPPLDFPVLAGRPHHVRTFWCEDPRA
ncbi:class I SAM-dependent methyltransferase, partial [bacterium]|nr:class I SAM-dependent methyltransferase [bacterium]